MFTRTLNLLGNIRLVLTSVLFQLFFFHPFVYFQVKGGETVTLQHSASQSALVTYANNAPYGLNHKPVHELLLTHRSTRRFCLIRRTKITSRWFILLSNAA